MIPLHGFTSSASLRHHVTVLSFIRRESHILLQLSSAVHRQGMGFGGAFRPGAEAGFIPSFGFHKLRGASPPLGGCC